MTTDATRFVYEQPLRVYWELTRACDLACRHCRAAAAPDPHPGELTTAEGLQLLRQLAAREPFPHLVLTGGDPLKRADLFTLITGARALGLHVSIAPSATPLLTGDVLRRFRAAGVDAISLSLDGSNAGRHDAIRGISGTYERTLAAASVARAIGLPFQVNTLVCTETADDLPRIYEQVAAIGAARWSLFFLVTVGRGELLASVTPERAEQILAWIAALSRPGRGAPVITTTEAPQLRRIVLERRRAAAASESNGAPLAAATHAAGVRDGNGILFISHVGDICPSGFLEVCAGNVRRDDVLEVYSRAPLFRQLRQPDRFGGRCGACEYRSVCGGSRARAYSAAGDLLGEDSLCAYQPRSARGDGRQGDGSAVPGVSGESAPARA
jgi:radical SAM protein